MNKPFKYRTIVIREPQTVVPCKRFANKLVGDIKIINRGTEDTKVLDILVPKNGGELNLPANQGEHNTTELEFLFPSANVGQNPNRIVFILAKVFEETV